MSFENYVKREKRITEPTFLQKITKYFNTYISGNRKKNLNTSNTKSSIDLLLENKDVEEIKTLVNDYDLYSKLVKLGFKSENDLLKKTAKELNIPRAVVKETIKNYKKTGDYRKVIKQKYTTPFESDAKPKNLFHYF